MRRNWFNLALVSCVVAAPLITVVSLRLGTVRSIARIEALGGQNGELAELAKTVGVGYNSVDSPDGLEWARRVMDLKSVTNLTVIRFNGEGLPYYYGYVAYDTNKQQIIGAGVDQLW